MRSGRHFAQFAMVQGDWMGMMFGVVRPGWDVEGGENAFNVATASINTIQPTGNATPTATPTGRGCRARSRATTSACSST